MEYFEITLAAGENRRITLRTPNGAWCRIVKGGPVAVETETP